MNDELKRQAEYIHAAGWTGVSSYWAAKNILDLISQIEVLTKERDAFALHIARTQCA